MMVLDNGKTTCFGQVMQVRFLLPSNLRNRNVTGDNMQNKFKKPTCQVDNVVREYDLCLTARDKEYEDNYVFLGCGTLHTVKGIPQTDTRDMYFYKKRTT